MDVIPKWADAVLVPLISSYSCGSAVGACDPCDW